MADGKQSLDITYLPPPMLPCQKWVDGLFLLVQRAVCKDDAINVCERPS